MNRLTMAAAAVAAGLLAGCIAPAPNATASGAPADTRITIAPDLCGDVCVTDARIAKGTSAFYTFQANLVNNRSRPLAVDWKVQWLDGDGMEIDSAVSAWNSRMLQPYEIRALKGTAPSPAAADMRIYVRRKK